MTVERLRPGSEEYWQERRKHPRARFDWPVTLVRENGDSVSGRVRDISRGGVLVQLPEKIDTYEQVKLGIELPDFEDVISATGAVVRRVERTENGSVQFQLGIRFTDISDHDLRYFSGNLAPEWQEFKGKASANGEDWQPAPEKEREKPDATQGRERARNLLPLAATVIGLVVLAIFLFQSVRYYSSQEEMVTGVGSSIVASEQETQQADRLDRLEKRMQNTNRLLDRLEARLAHLEREMRDRQGILKDFQARISRLEEPVGPVKGIIRESGDSQAGKAEGMNPVSRHGILRTGPLTVISRTGQLLMPRSTKRKPNKKISGYHTVRQGETIGSISRKYGLSVDELLRLNDLSDDSVIRTGQKLRIDKKRQ